MVAVQYLGWMRSDPRLPERMRSVPSGSLLNTISSVSLWMTVSTSVITASGSESLSGHCPRANKTVMMSEADAPKTCLIA